MRETLEKQKNLATEIAAITRYTQPKLRHRHDVDARTYVCLHCERNNAILHRGAPRRTGIAQRYEEVLQMQWSQLYSVDVSFWHACCRNAN